MNIVYITLIALLLSACKVQVVSPQGGDVTWDGGECFEGSVCVIDVEETTFSKTFTATPKDGYEFVGWKTILRLNNNPTEPLIMKCDTAECTIGFDAISDSLASMLIDSYHQSSVTPIYRLLDVTRCSDSDVVCGYDIPSYQIEQTSTSSLLITIPAGKTVSQAFTTTAAPVTYGRFVFHQVTGEISPAIDIWISNAPNGEPISSKCHYSDGLKASEFNWMVSEPYINWWCEMESKTNYYLNVKHSNPTLSYSSRIERLIKVGDAGDF